MYIFIPVHTSLLKIPRSQPTCHNRNVELPRTKGNRQTERSSIDTEIKGKSDKSERLFHRCVGPDMLIASSKDGASPGDMTKPIPE